MTDLQIKLAQLESDASECELIAQLATDTDKRAAYTRLAVQYRAMADDIRQVISSIRAAE